MDNELMVFQNPEFGEFRTAEIDGKRWFCLADVCRPLGIKPKDCKTRLKEKGVATIDTLTNGGNQKMLWVDEANMYRAIFQSVKPEAERFMDWVTEEVLPSINHTGSYSLQPKPQMTPAELLAAQANLLVDLEKRTSAIEQKVDRALTAMARPEADTWVADMKEAIRVYCEATGLTDAAGRGRLYAALDREAKCNTDTRLRRLRERKKKVGETRRNYMALTKLDAIAADGKLRAAFEGIVARETARAAVK
ncbi:MAG: hypothetical protein HDT20_04220 [Oscillibacter sp.]|nr:hypothetical protein [Oscillibacter sp.]